MGVALVAHLMGGLGNQMFQYAAARALAERNGAKLYLDTRTGFVRDRMFKRVYELDSLPIRAAEASWLQALPFSAELIVSKLVRSPAPAIKPRIYGSYITEPSPEFLPEVVRHSLARNAWMRGYWQTEKYFRDFAPALAAELSPPPPASPRFLECARLMKSVNSVAVGVRLFEEVPGSSKTGVGGLTPISFFNAGAREIAKTVKNPVFFVFCTKSASELAELELPGETHLLTHDNGFPGSLSRLWLASHCRHHIISNSSFYWWGAWLAESRYDDCRVIASSLFSNRDGVPSRWLSM